MNDEVFCFSQPSGHVTTTSSKVYVVPVAVVMVTWLFGWDLVLRGGALMFVMGSLRRMSALATAVLETWSRMRLYVDATMKLP